MTSRQYYRKDAVTLDYYHVTEQWGADVTDPLEAIVVASSERKINKQQEMARLTQAIANLDVRRAELVERKRALAAL